MLNAALALLLLHDSVLPHTHDVRVLVLVGMVALVMVVVYHLTSTPE